MFKKICILILSVTLVLNSTGTMTTSFANDDNVIDKSAINGQQIEQLLDQRLNLLNNKNIDYKELDKIDQKLVKLGAKFLTESEVEEMIYNLKLQGEYNDILLRSGIIQPNIVTPSSSVNYWISYRYSNRFYNGKYYNVQNLVAQPKNDNSGLSRPGAKGISFSTDWKAGTSTFFTSVFNTTLSSVHWSATVYDILKSTWSSLQTVSDIKPADVYYVWTSTTEATFSYVKVEGQSDASQQLTNIATKNNTNLGYILRVNSWRPTPTSAWIFNPQVPAGNISFANTPTGYANTNAAISNYVTGGGTYYNFINYLDLKAPESKSIITIYPPKPQFPLECEY